MTARNGRTGHDKCLGRKRDGSGGLCQRPAGWGTDHPGIGRCKGHGGCTPSHEAAAHRELVAQAEREALAVLRTMDVAPLDVHPLQLLAQIAAEVRQWQTILRGRVAELDSLTVRTRDGQERIRAVILAWERATAQATALGALLARLDLDGRLAEITAQQGAQLVACMSAILAALGHDPRDPHVGAIVARELRAIGGSGA